MIYLTVWDRQTWQEFLDSPRDVYGMGPKYEGLGDRLICYRRGKYGKSEFVAVLEVTSISYWDNRNLIWSEEVYPVRVRVRVDIFPAEGVKVLDLRKKLALFKRVTNPRRWGNFFHQAIRPWDDPDARIVIRALKSVPSRQLPS